MAGRLRAPRKQQKSCPLRAVEPAGAKLKPSTYGKDADRAAASAGPNLRVLKFVLAKMAPGRRISRSMTKTIAIVTPVLDDWVSFARLVGEISDLFADSEFVFHICAVDDGSNGPFDADAVALPEASCIRSIEVIRLAVNLGHQRAIAVGLCAVADSTEIDAVLVMDSDGQDRPADIALLLVESLRQPGLVVLARRARRAESYAFRLWYRLYKLAFYGLTGQPITFGNYCVLPMSAVRRLVRMPEMWNHLAASVMRSRLVYTTVPTARGNRYAGGSKMNLASLVLHGLSAMSVYTDRILVRIMLAAALVGVTAGFGVAAVAGIRIATDLAIPGWATTAAGDLLIILFQTLVIVVAAILLFLAGRSHRPFIPILDYQPFIVHRERYFPFRHMGRLATALAAE
jgi:polyisoprenyl-phosphate glycosyltransferase